MNRVLLGIAEVDKQAKGLVCALDEERHRVEPATEAQPKPTAAKGERARSAPRSKVGTLNDLNEHQAISLCLSELQSRFHFTCVWTLVRPWKWWLFLSSFFVLFWFNIYIVVLVGLRLHKTKIGLESFGLGYLGLQKPNITKTKTITITISLLTVGS